MGVAWNEVQRCIHIMSRFGAASKFQRDHDRQRGVGMRPSLSFATPQDFGSSDARHVSYTWLIRCLRPESESAPTDIRRAARSALPKTPARICEVQGGSMMLARHLAAVHPALGFPHELQVHRRGAVQRDGRLAQHHEALVGRIRQRRPQHQLRRDVQAAAAPPRLRSATRTGQQSRLRKCMLPVTAADAHADMPSRHCCDCAGRPPVTFARISVCILCLPPDNSLGIAWRQWDATCRARTWNRLQRDAPLSCWLSCGRRRSCQAHTLLRSRRCRPGAQRESARLDSPHIWAPERGAQSRWFAPEQASLPGRTAIVEDEYGDGVRACNARGDTGVQAAFGTPVVYVDRVEQLPGAAHGRSGRVDCRAVGAICVHLQAKTDRW